MYHSTITVVCMFLYNMVKPKKKSPTQRNIRLVDYSCDRWRQYRTAY